MNNPKVFISYSWTNEEYKAKIRQIAEELVEQGVEVILDQWDLRPGHNRFAFMEQSIERADKVLIMCDKRYVEKANSREGGVGTETSIITPEIYGRSDQEKFIPIIMEAWELVPTYMKSNVGIDFRGKNPKAELDEMLRAIYDEPEYKKPPLGKMPKRLENQDKLSEHNEYHIDYDDVARRVHETYSQLQEKLEKSIEENNEEEEEHLQAQIDGLFRGAQDMH